MKEVCVGEVVRFGSNITIGGIKYWFNKIYGNSANDIEKMKDHASSDGVKYYARQKIKGEVLLFGVSVVDENNH